MVAMENAVFLLFLSLLASTTLVHANFNVAAGTDDGSEQWGYVEVRPKAHMFWWLYKSPYRVEDPSKPWPILLWLQGGPGGSGVGFGNFVEIGPLDTNLEPRNSTWLKKADLLFVDSPVGTGFSYVEDDNLAVKTDVESATDLTTLLKELFNGNKSLQRSPLYIFAESYGGKFAVTLGVAALQAIEKGELKLQLGGVALGDSWISPEDYVFSWGPVLKTMSRLDDGGLNRSNSSVAQKIHQQLVEGQFEDATGSFFDLEQVIADGSNDVDFYNFMLDAGTEGLGMKGYSTYLTTKFSSVHGSSDDLYSLMNGPIKKKLKIIPKNVSWGGQNIVFDALAGDFMRPRIAEADVLLTFKYAFQVQVDELLAKGINVTVYNGQIDLICATKGTEAWMNKLKWDGLPNFFSTSRAPLYCGSDDVPTTKGFLASYKNLFFYWILGAGHFPFYLYIKMAATRDTLLLLSLLVSASLVHGNVNVVAAGTDDGSEQGGYVEVRPKAHLFWWFYKSPYRVEDPSKPWPIVIWLQGGPGGSGVGFGNFLEIGPLDVNLEPRSSTWLKKADLLFVDNPVATGFSYVEDANLAVKTDVEAATDLTTLLKELFNENENLQKSPLFIFAESYGGKFAVTLGVSALQAIENGELKVQLGGVALGDSWISPEDFVLSWGPLLKDISRLDSVGLNRSNSLAQKIQQQLAGGQYDSATSTWFDLEDVIENSSNNVLDEWAYQEKLKIIPKNVIWGGQPIVFEALSGDFMRPRIAEVDELLAKSVNVTIYNGQVDLICSTKGTEAWVDKLKWDGLETFLSLSRTPLYCGDDTATKAFVRSYKNLFFYWILGAGHFVPVDQPCISLQMVGSITQSPSSSS
ncbi:hypothetical protein RJ640_024095 [Escallonia rubra]|uniref:Carboxypeptidase n=1 Tax=Escallonia rubra TaxID=112253 RepID=A0AA88RAN8_9ASTE|nr:hypothetical protein RJ640_024095 [Escallonia rubra]